jgi:glucose-6-phosphate 1-dehydrogenase
MKSWNTDPEVSEKTMAAVNAPDLGIDAQDCLRPVPGDPCTIVILGATGDLTTRKLMPALFDLYLNEGLPDQFLIVGSGRIDIDRQRKRAERSEKCRCL